MFPLGRHFSIAGSYVVVRLLCVVVCLCGVASVFAQKKSAEEKIILEHADKVMLDEKKLPGIQVFVGNVRFYHDGVTLLCDSAHFLQQSNSFNAFGNVRMTEGDTLSLVSKRLFYDGNTQTAEAREEVVLTHRTSTLYTDSLNYDRLYSVGYFFEGGRLVDDATTLTSDWGQYDAATREALFNYHVTMTGEDYVLWSDTLYYDTVIKRAHVRGPSNVNTTEAKIYTEDAFYYTESGDMILLDRSVVVNAGTQMTGDSVSYNRGGGVAEAFGNVIINDKKNKSIMTGNYCFYDERIGYSITYDSALVKNYQEADTLYLHADTFKVFTFNMNTDSVYRKMLGYRHARSYRVDVQGISDSLVFDSKLSRLEMYGNPILWSDNRQILGEEIYVFLNDSTVDSVRVERQCLLAEQVDTVHYNQVAGLIMRFFFEAGELKMNEVEGNVAVNYYAFDDDSVMIGLNHTETSLLRLYMKDKKTDKIWTRESNGTFYPLSFVTPTEAYLENFVWFDYVRPLYPMDVFVWRSKKRGTELKQSTRRNMPFQVLKPKKDG